MDAPEEDLPTRDEFLALLWSNIINEPMSERWIDAAIRASERRPSAAFGDIGPVLQRLLSLGATRRELSLLQRYACYGAVFSTFYQLSDPGIAPEDADALFEDLLSADPSGLEAGPGSAPAPSA